MDKFTRNTLFVLLATVALGGIFLSRAITATNLNPTESTPQPGTLNIKLNKLDRPSHARYVIATVTLTNKTDTPIFYNQYSLHAFVYEPSTRNQIDTAAAMELRAMLPSDVKVILPAESHEIETSSWMIPQTLESADVVVRLEPWMKVDTRMISNELKQKYPNAVLLSAPAVTPAAQLPK